MADDRSLRDRLAIVTSLEAVPWVGGVGVEELFSGGLSFDPAVSILFPDPPGDTGELVGKRDGGAVVSSALLDLERPLVEGIFLPVSLGGSETGPGAMNEEHP